MSSRRPNGGLEREILQQLWASSVGGTPREILDALASEGVDLAYTTVMTTLTRLWHKGLVSRAPEGKSYRYQALQGEADLAASKMSDLLDHTDNRKEALARFVSGLSRRDEQVLRGLLAEFEK